MRLCLSLQVGLISAVYLKINIANIAWESNFMPSRVRQWRTQMLGMKFYLSELIMKYTKHLYRFVFID